MFSPQNRCYRDFGMHGYGGDIAKNQIPLFTRNPTGNKEVK